MAKVCILHSICCFFATLAVTSSQKTYSCPGLSEDPVVVPDDSGSSITPQINRSSPNTVCVLTRVSARTDNANLDNIQRNSSNEDYYIVPVARSYNNRNWERVAGPYVQDLSISGCCNLDIPILPNLPSGKFVLMTFTFQPSTREKVARFLQQTTFGPTLDMIDAWNYGNDLTQEMGKWLKTQMDESQTPPTSHRAFFRERANYPVKNQNAHQFVRPRHPCSKYARYREYSFTTEDYMHEILVTRTSGQFLISVDGHPRTLRSTWKDDNTGVNIGTGTFQFCWHTDEMLNGEVWIYNPRTTDCHLVYNNRPNLPSNIHDSSFREVSLPNKESFEAIAAIPAQQFYVMVGEGLYLKNQLNNSECSNIDDDGVYQNVLGTFPNGQQAYYAGYAKLDENTLERPIEDGGVEMMKVNITGYDEWESKPLCPVPFKSFVNIDSCYLSTTSAFSCSASWMKSREGNRAVVCGSPGEVTNDPSKPNTFFFPYSPSAYDAGRQKKDVWNMISLNEADQLRQRMAWALSQILVVTPNQINEDSGYSEIYLKYYDIFVRHAFGNYFDILKEVSYSPMMAEMLSYLDSKSSAYVLESSGAKSNPDENYAREVMQLFSIGLYQLNLDGTKKLDSSGNPMLTYDNTDIQNFARAWTGFTRAYKRSNVEMEWWDWKNRLDTMKIRGEYRDPFPKIDLNDGFIGDKVPLCVELPSKHFLKKGAQYRLLGSSPQPDLHEYGWQWNEWDDDWFSGPGDRQLFLSTSSNLRKKLKASNDVIVTLDSDLACIGNECDVDSIIVVQVQSNPPLYYEYMKPPCVELSFYDNAKKITAESGNSMCGNPNLDSAYDACCEEPNASYAMGAGMYCLYDFERTTQSTARSRCQSTFPGGDLCHFYYLSTTDSCKTENWNWWMQDKWYWTDEDCTIQVKVNEEGSIAIVHIPPLLQDHPDSDHVQRIDLRVNPDNTNYFKVNWDGDEYPRPSNSCGNGACHSTYRSCLCELHIVETGVFNSLPSAAQIVNSLHIGSVDPTSLTSYNQVSNTGNNIKVWHKNGGYDKDTVFSVTYRGKETFLKNMKSTVQISGATQYQFRNPPSFMNLGFREKRDAAYETDAVLETYFWNSNIAPFLAVRLIQRFGISNPSPRYVEAVATAFQQGTYSNPDISTDDFGNGQYGNLEAMVAAMVLDPEARSAVLDADPTAGSLVEPVLKITRFLRAMKFEPSQGERIRLENLEQKIGQEAHSSPSVFSFFRPEYTAPGHIKEASITSPEAQVLTGPKVIALLNGIISLVDLGLNSCFGGFGEAALWWCEGLENYYSEDETEFGTLRYTPSSNNVDDTVEELSLLLTAGRLGSESKHIISNAYSGENNAVNGLRLAQKLIATTPEWHSTTVFNKSTTSRPEVEKPTSSNRDYKAVIFMMLDGGSDSHNMLVPHSGCSGGKTSYNHYASVRGQIAIPKADLLQIDASSSSQVCTTFGIHPNLPFLKTMYDEGDLLWMANIGVLQQHVTQDNWWDLTDETVLFAHNVQYEEVHNMDIYENQVGRGVGGRMADILKRNGYSSTAISLAGIADAVATGLATSYTLDPWAGLQQLNPMSWGQPLWSHIKNLNSASNIGSNLFAETWSNAIFKAVGENDLLKDTLDSTTLDTTFPPENFLAQQFELVSKLIKSKDERGVERDVFYVELSGFDTHDNIKDFLDQLTITMNAGIESFATEMRAQNAWNDVTLVMVSEFARTLPGNTGVGSDHAWGGNYFIAGGAVKGKRIIGEYPDILSEDGPLIIEPGIVIPTKPFDAPWNGVAQWFGITRAEDLDEVLPNRNNFPNDLFDQNDLYETRPTAAPTSANPTPANPTCADSPFRFRVTKTDGKTVSRGCDWVANKSTNLRCQLNGVTNQCPSTCDTCKTCADSELRFRFKFADKGMITRDCAWVLRKNTNARCRVDGMKNTCRETCNNC